MKISRFVFTVLALSITGHSQEIRMGHTARAELRTAVSGAPTRPEIPFSALTPQQRRQAIDQVWGPGPSTNEKLQRFDTFWEYVDANFAAFQNLDVDWAGLRARYRPEIEAGVSRGRFAAIMNHLSLALRDSHSGALDLDVNIFTTPQPGIPLLGVGGWDLDPTGTCSTAQPDGSALIYRAVANHPLGLRRGDRVLGYDGRPWVDLYQELLAEEIPIWPIWWGSAPSAYEHSFVMAATQNRHLFQTMDILKVNGTVVHVPTNLLQGPIWIGPCDEQMSIQGVPKPTGYSGNRSVNAGIIPGTRSGYVYNWAWTSSSEFAFANAVYYLTYIQRVEALIIDFRYNVGGLIRAPQLGTGLLFAHPVPTIGFDKRRNPGDHFAMKRFWTPDLFVTDFDYFPDRRRILESFNGPIAVLVGPGALSTGDLSPYWLTYHPRVRTFGKSTASTFNVPTQPALGNEIDLGPDWDAGIAFANAYRINEPNQYLTRTEFPVDEPIWLTPTDVAVGRDTVVDSARNWIVQQTSP